MAIPPMDENLKQLLSAFNANHVKYVIIGGYAAWRWARRLSAVGGRVVVNGVLPPLFSKEERAVLAYTDAMTIDVRVPPQIFAAVSAQLSPREMVELTAIVEPIRDPTGEEPDEDRTVRYDYVGDIMKKHGIRMLTTSGLPGVAETARRELRV